MPPLPVIPTLLRPAVADTSRVVLTYILPSMAVFYVVLSGLWLVPDSFAGMYGNHDGHWASWSARGILEWSAFLDFSPFSPLTGSGSLFVPNLPWLNPGARPWRSRRLWRCGTLRRCWCTWRSCQRRSICCIAISSSRGISRF